jgi:hypothetical protein
MLRQSPHRILHVSADACNLRSATDAFQSLFGLPVQPQEILQELQVARINQNHNSIVGTV